MIKELIEKIVVKLKDDADIKSYCNTNFGKNIAIIVGQSKERPVTTAYMPAIEIAFIDSKKVNDQSRLLTFAIGVFVQNDAVIAEETPEEELPPLNHNVMTYEGFVQCNELIELIESALLLMPFKAEIVYENLQCDFWPIFSGVINFNVEKKLPLRGVIK